MSHWLIEDAGWKAIMADPRLQRARTKLSMHEIRLIVRHARASVDGRRMAETENTGSVPQGTTSAVGSEASETPTPSSAQRGDA